MLDWSEFVDLAKEAFGFLVEEFGFRCASETSPFVVFSNERVDISIFYDANRNGELDLGLKRKEDVENGKPFYRIDQFKELHGHKFPEPMLSPFLQSREDAVRELNSLASQLRLHCAPVLGGDLSDIERIDREC